MSRIIFLFLTFFALGAFAIVSLIITVFAWFSPAPRLQASHSRVRSSRLRDDDPVVLQLVR